MSISNPPKYSVRQKALWLLARREYSYQELFRKLSRNYLPNDIHHTLNDFVEKGFLNDQRAGLCFIQNQSLKKNGPHKIYFEAQQKGIPLNLIQHELTSIDFQQQARELLLKKFTFPLDTIYQKKAFSFLLRKGYSFDIIQAVFTDLNK